MTAEVMVSDQALSNWFQYPAHADNIRMRFVNVLEELVYKRCAAAANIGGSTYHSALAMYGNQPIRPATKLRLAHKKIFIVDEVNIVGLKALTQLNDRCNAIWDTNRHSSTVFGGIPIVIFLEDLNQFTPVADRAIWRQDLPSQVSKGGKSI
ncbi:hypothetical protein BDZ45DRAFT_755527 [Acephala macrosclerotiorum]|nr:hypothetical protein BDZ45DRAFT_755527 [Acephala macrosclerotiorum]